MRPEEDINSAEWEGHRFGAIRGCMFALPFGIACWALIIWFVIEWAKYFGRIAG